MRRVLATVGVPVAAVLLAALLMAGGCTAAAAGGAAASGATPAASGIEGGQPSSVTVRDVIDRADLVGRVVNVGGRCLALGDVVAHGPPPRTRSDWQLADGDVAVWVVGARPTDCTPAAGAPSAGTITARVAQDTVRVMPSDAGRVRRYLVRMR